MKSKYLLLLLIVLIVIMIDRIFFMPNRLENVWSYESGIYFGDPIGYNQDFIYQKGKIIITGSRLNGTKYILLGCYFDNLIFFDLKTLTYSRYIDFYY